MFSFVCNQSSEVDCSAKINHFHEKKVFLKNIYTEVRTDIANDL